MNGREVQVNADKSVSHHRRCPSCKKDKLITVLLFNERGPPENWRETLSSNKSRE
jgi:hypothetical protein